MFKALPWRRAWRTAYHRGEAWTRIGSMWPEPEPEWTFLHCHGCGEIYVDSYSQATAVESALQEGWTTDGAYLHCPACPPLEVRGITQAVAMRKGHPVVQIAEGIPQL